ncbi:phosphatase PAP2 family protein [Streptomyces sp. NPDC101118]|uniref:phosphatase PAP2 family protein n=1 Tax=Streptomyces sp. NPDC101118 TaxID=3366109 RepID=UPI003806AC68
MPPTRGAGRPADPRHPFGPDPDSIPVPDAVRPTGHHLPAVPPRSTTAWGCVLISLAAAIGLFLRGDGPPFFQGLDDSWERAMDGSRAGAVSGLAVVLDRLGGPLGVVVPLALVGCLCVYGRWRSGLFAFAAAVGANILVVLPLKQLADRPRPPHPWVLVNDGSYPSGQVFTAATLVVVTGLLLFPPRVRRWWWPAAALYVGAMMWSRTWLHAQWLSDTAAGALAGVGATLLLWRAFRPLLREEGERLAAGRLW